MRIALIFLSVLSTLFLTGAAPGTAPPEWSFNATIIEACSCPMFCQCFFNTEPAAPAAGEHGAHHGGSRYCLGNLAYRVNKGTYAGTKLDGAKFWLAGDLGSDFTTGQAEWGILTFDPAVTPKQRDAIQAILPKIYPLKWKSFKVAADAPIDWNATKEIATARLDGGKGGEVTLDKFAGMSSDPVVINNLRYVGAPRNDGFYLMPNKVEAWKGENAFEFHGTNGFTVTIDMNSKDTL
jgi:hypothetical protein